jgi:hypothetical protein
MPLPICYLNGTFLPLAEARVSPLDRGFLFGDAVYEVVPVYGSRPFRLREHLDRLDRSLDGIRMPPVMSPCDWAHRSAQELIPAMTRARPSVSAGDRAAPSTAAIMHGRRICSRRYSRTARNWSRWPPPCWKRRAAVTADTFVGHGATSSRPPCSATFCSRSSAPTPARSKPSCSRTANSPKAPRPPCMWSRMASSTRRPTAGEYFPAPPATWSRNWPNA